MLGITHFSKGSQGRDPTERVTGSLAFGALARVVLATAKRTEDDGSTTRLLARSKSNLGTDDGGFRYAIHEALLNDGSEIETSRVVWGEIIQGSARDLLASIEEPIAKSAASALSDAKAWLADLLSDGPRPQEEVAKLAAAAGHSKATLRRAKDALGVRSITEGIGKGWCWHLPAGRGYEQAS